MLFLGCLKDCGCVEKSMAGLVEVYASQQLNNKSDFTGEKYLIEAVLVYLSGVKTQRLKQLWERGRSLRGLPSEQTSQ